MISAKFYPEWSYEKAVKHSGKLPGTVKFMGQEQINTSEERKGASGPKRNVAATTANEGMRRGKRIDKELASIASLIQSSRMRVESNRGETLNGSILSTADFVLDPPVRGRRDAYGVSVSKRRFLTTRQQRTFTNIRRNIHSFTQKIVWFLYRTRLEPWRAQYAVGNNYLKLATAVDLLCRYINPVTQRPIGNGDVVIEIKTGYASYYRSHTRFHLRPPFDTQTDCPKNQHQIQLAVTVWLYQNERLRITGVVPEICAAMVIQVHESGIAVYPNEQWANIRDETLRASVFDLLK